MTEAVKEAAEHPTDQANARFELAIQLLEEARRALGRAAGLTGEILAL